MVYGANNREIVFYLLLRGRIPRNQLFSWNLLNERVLVSQVEFRIHSLRDPKP